MLRFYIFMIRSSYSHTNDINMFKIRSFLTTQYIMTVTTYLPLSIIVQPIDHSINYLSNNLEFIHTL